MEQDFWLNLASKDLAKAKNFFIDLGFTINERHSSSQMVSLLIGNQKLVLNLFTEKLFQSFLGEHPVTNTRQSNEVLFSIGASSPKEVDAMAKKAVDAGGTLYAKPGLKDEWMYGCGFADLDGHRWNVLFMDFSKMPNSTV